MGLCCCKENKDESLDTRDHSRQPLNIQTPLIREIPPPTQPNARPLDRVPPILPVDDRIQPRKYGTIRKNESVESGKTYHKILFPQEDARPLHQVRPILPVDDRIQPREYGTIRRNESVESGRTNHKVLLPQKDARPLHRVRPILPVDDRIQPREYGTIKRNESVESGRTNHKILLPQKDARSLHRVRPILPVDDRIQPREYGTIRRNESVESGRTYHKILFPQESRVNLLIDQKRHKHISYKKRINLDIYMLKNLFQALCINKPEIPTEMAYTTDILEENSKDYRFARSQLINRKFNENYNIKGIIHIWNPYIFAQYKLNKLMNNNRCEKRLLFHGTSSKNLISILTHNLDWRKVMNGKYGRGVSFANNPWYASHYSVKDSSYGNNYVMILAKVLIGETSIGDSTTVVPAIGDTTTRPEDGQVLVKYDDCTFYPEFVIFFEKRIVQEGWKAFADDEDWVSD